MRRSRGGREGGNKKGKKIHVAQLEAPVAMRCNAVQWSHCREVKSDAEQCRCRRNVAAFGMTCDATIINRIG